MINYNIALDKVKTMLEISSDKPSDLIILEDETIDFEFGWVFFYQTRKFIETGNIFDALGGNAPIIINKHDGSSHVTGTAYPIEKYIDDYIMALKGR